MENAVKNAAAKGLNVRGVFMSFGMPAIVELLALVDIDFVYIDGEHGCFEWRDIEAMCIAAEYHGITTIARIPDASVATVTRFLDRGVKGVIVPHVNSVEQAKAVVDAAYYAPLGNRSFGGTRPKFVYGVKQHEPEFLAECNRTTLVSIMVETREALAAAGDIAALEGVDFMSFGMMDLSQALGHAGNPGHADVAAAVEEASGRIRSAGIPVREDFMTYAWINDVVIAGAKALKLDSAAN